MAPHQAARGPRRRVLRKRNKELASSGEDPAAAGEDGAVVWGGRDGRRVRIIQENGRNVRIIKVVGSDGNEEEWEEYSEHGSDADGDEADDEEDFGAFDNERRAEGADHDGDAMRSGGLVDGHGGDLSVQVSATTTAEQLQETFSAFGTVVGIEVLKDTGGHSLGTAIVSFDSAGGAAKVGALYTHTYIHTYVHTHTNAHIHKYTRHRPCRV